MQTIRVPYRTDTRGRELIASLRRVQSAAVRSAFANASRGDGGLVDEKDLRFLVKQRFGTGVLDSWALHCAARAGRAKRKAFPEGKVVFGGKGHLERRRKGLIRPDEWRARRLLPFISYGDRQKAFGNQNVQLIGERTIRLKIGRRLSGGRNGGVVTDTAELHLTQMTGNAGEVLRQVADLCAKSQEKDRINVSFAIDERFVSITIDPEDLPDHPDRCRPVQAIAGRAVGIDLNPSWIGLAAIANATDPAALSQTTLLDWKLIKLEHEPRAPAEAVREVLAVAADRAVRLARQYGAGLIVVEKGLGKLRSRGKNRKLNQLLNHWGRTIFLQMLRRKANLAGIKVVEVWGGYSTTIGNAAFEAPDACASASEIARRGLALRAGIKDLFPSFSRDVTPGLWKDQVMRPELRKELELANAWQEVHRAIKAAKTFGYRRPHPRLDADPGGRHPDGIAVRRLGRRRRPGLIARPVGPGRSKQTSSDKRELVS
ncbi:IS605 OrfB family transposase [Bradyrhizobium sp. USDA 4341]